MCARESCLSERPESSSYIFSRKKKEFRWRNEVKPLVDNVKPCFNVFSFNKIKFKSQDPIGPVRSSVSAMICPSPSTLHCSEHLGGMCDMGKKGETSDLDRVINARYRGGRGSKSLRLETRSLFLTHTKSNQDVPGQEATLSNAPGGNSGMTTVGFPVVHRAWQSSYCSEQKEIGADKGEIMRMSLWAN